MTEDCFFLALHEAPTPSGIVAPSDVRYETFTSHAKRNWQHPRRLKHAGALQQLFYPRSTVHLFSTLDGNVVHRSVVHGRDFRFPFMAPQDLMVGAVWTATWARGNGLASIMLGRIAQSSRCPGPFRYVTEKRNRASIRVAEKAGFVPVGVGRKNPRLGRSEFGSYTMTENPQA